MSSAKLIAQGINRRRSILRYIGNYIDKRGYAPSVEEIAECQGINKTAVRRHLQVMIEEGVLEHKPGHHRSLRILSSTTPPVLKR